MLGAGLSPDLVHHSSSACCSTASSASPGTPPDTASRGAGHSHSMVPGGLLVTSTTTRLTSRTSLVIRLEMRASTS